MDRDVVICDVSPRDGLQNENLVVAPAVRAELCKLLAVAGVPRVEAVSFVHPGLVPAMSGAEEVIGQLSLDSERTAWTGLVLNPRGFERAIASGLRRINYTLAVTDTFCRRNQGCSRAEAKAWAPGFVAQAHEAGLRLTVTLAVSFGCPFEGRVPESETLGLALRMAELGFDEIVLADTIGVAVPSAVRSMIAAASSFGVPLGVHFHDTRNTGVANVVTALEAGVALFDTAAGGTGGCPFAPGASGNVATEDVVYVLEEMGVRTGIDLEALRECSAWLGRQLGRQMPSAVATAGGFPTPAG